MMVHDFVLMISSIDISFLMWKFGGWEICTKTSDGRWGWPTHMHLWWVHIPGCFNMDWLLC
jgi:hypothetical protein